ncbi:MAG: hypothetical protein Q8P67_24045 [archaeon]|nr:hypothetical protein [archaeon]
MPLNLTEKFFSEEYFLTGPLRSLWSEHQKTPFWRNSSISQGESDEKVEGPTRRLGEEEGSKFDARIKSKNKNSEN